MELCLETNKVFLAFPRVNQLINMLFDFNQQKLLGSKITVDRSNQSTIILLSVNDTLIAYFCKHHIIVLDYNFR